MPKSKAKEILEAAYAAVRAAGLRARNWSGGGKIVLAIYEPGDQFVGSVVFTDKEVIRESKGWSKADLRVFAELARAYSGPGWKAT